MLGAPNPSSLKSLHNSWLQPLIPISPLHAISNQEGKRAFRPVNIRETPAFRTAKMSERPHLTTCACLLSTAKMGCHLFKAPSENPTDERENIFMSWEPKSLSNTTDSTQCNSGNASDDDRPARITNTDVSHQEQPALSTTTPQADADEPYHVFGNRMKWAVVAQIGVAGTFSGLSSNIYFPCLKTITEVN